MSNPYTIVTICTHIPTQHYYCLREFFKSIGNETPNTLVLNGEYVQYGGLGSKPRGVLKAIREGLINTKYFIFTDCFDFVFVREPKHLFEKYLDWYPESPIVVSSEKNCYPDDLKLEYDEVAEKALVKSSYKYLNSGLIIGETEAMLTLLEAMDAENIPNDYWDAEKQQQINPNDQFYYQQMFLKQPVKMSLDYNQILCNTLHSVSIDDLQFEQQGIFNRETGSVPCSFHFNGSAKTDGLMKPILSHLNLL